jgi:hypothetical protein
MKGEYLNLKSLYLFVQIPTILVGARNILNWFTGFGHCLKMKDLAMKIILSLVRVKHTYLEIFPSQTTF